MSEADKITTRLEQLHQEWKNGQQQLAKLEQQRQDTQQTLLRIAGAIQVLQELLESNTDPVANVRAVNTAIEN